MERIKMHPMRTKVDKKYVGFKPNSGSIKPVHISSGAFRAILGETFSAEGIKRLSYVSNAKGEPPKWKDKKSTRDFMDEHGALDSDFRGDHFEAFRGVLQKLVSVDNGVYGIDDDMLSYTAGSSAFVVAKGMLEDAGDFIGAVIKTYCPELSAYLADVLKQDGDPISLAFEPIIKVGEWKQYNQIALDDIQAFEKMNPQVHAYLNSLKESGLCMKSNLEIHPNRLTQLRLFNLFCIFFVVRYLSLLESFYCGEMKRPILLDFSEDNRSSVARTSVLSYSQLHKSISRFYAWAFAEELKTQWSNDELLASNVPIYEDKLDKNGNPVEPKNKDGLANMWQIAKDDARNASDEDAYLVFGTAIYDMIALEATSHPVNYLRKLGTEIGFLYPPTNFHIDKRFALSEDMIEMILRCCVLPNQTLTASELRSRLWDRFGIVVGGGENDIARLSEMGSIVYADSDSLQENFLSFADTLQNIGFAEQLPDGILRICFGGTTV
ncbi:MAG: hypothetical protein LBV65_02785 [Desulfovibrio sp.]|jgi:hypothetical protein|nr:hypothetical protein [Desulfovibrio sp.]